MGDQTRDERARRQALLFGVFQANKGLIARVLRRYAVTRRNIDDLTQETITRALEAEQRTEIREPKRFLVGIAKNLARNELERQSKMAHDSIDDFAPETYVSDEPSVDEIVDARQRMAIFSAVVATLPPQCQRVFVLKYVYGTPHKEIARSLGIAVSTVEKHVALGLARCRQGMTDALGAGERDEPAVAVLDTDGRPERRGAK